MRASRSRAAFSFSGGTLARSRARLGLKLGKAPLNSGQAALDPLQIDVAAARCSARGRGPARSGAAALAPSLKPSPHMAGKLGVGGPRGQLLLPKIEQAAGQLVEGRRFGHGGSFCGAARHLGNAAILR